MRPSRPLTLLPAILLCVLRPAGPPALSAQETRGFRPADLRRVVDLRDPALSPDGSMLAFTVVRPVEGEDRVHRELWMQELEDGRPEGDPVRFSDPTEESRAPRWSPDGSLLSFVSPRRGETNPIWFLRVSGPGGEAFHLPGVEGRPLWSPDGTRIAYLKAPDEGGGEELFVVSGGGGEPRRLTALDVAVQEPVWAPDGEGLYFTARAPGTEAAPGEEALDVWYVPLKEGQAWRVTGEPGSEWAPALSADGERIAYLQRRHPRVQAEVQVAELRSDGFLEGEATTVTGGFDRDAGPPTWSPDGRSLLFPARDGPNRALYRVGTRGGSLTLVLSGEREVHDVALSPDGSLVAYTATEPTRPTELFVAEGDGSDEERVTRFNQEVVEGRELGEPARLAWRGEDGSEIEGWIVEPVGFQPGEAYPLAVRLHEGPHGAFGNAFQPTTQALAAAGFFVLYANLRGSDGYGASFRNANRGAWGRVESDDLLAGIDAALGRHPEIDPERVGVLGEGYGGFLAAWLTATTNRFAAAVPFRMVASWESWYGTSDARGVAERALGGPPWERRSLYRRLSPISYVENVTAPTLLLHDEANPRMPVSEAEQWHTALRRRGVEVTLVRYPAGARLQDGSLGPEARIDRLERTRDWLRRWLAPEDDGERLSGPPG